MHNDPYGVSLADLKVTVPDGTNTIDAKAYSREKLRQEQEAAKKENASLISKMPNRRERRMHPKLKCKKMTKCRRRDQGRIADAVHELRVKKAKENVKTIYEV